MTGSGRSDGAVVRWLTAQTAVFGVMAALLGIVANALFLEAFGSAWLPVTYILIGLVGIVLSGIVARGAQSVDLLRLAISVLGGAAAAIAASWIVAAGGGGAWVSVPLLVLFPVLIQLGFVFIGGQAGRLLDIAGIKARFPVIAAGFPVGAVVGGLLGGQLVSLFGRTEDLLLATAAAQGMFAALVWATGRRFPAELRASGGSAPAAAAGLPNSEPASERTWRRLFGRPFVALILAYQVLSALGSQLADFLVMDRAIATYPDPEDLARFLAGYTAAMNVASIAFLILVAGPLVRRFGLRLGITSNPLVLTVLVVGVVGAFWVAGPASVAMLAMVSGARIADVALTDGTTRTSINAMYQVLPDRVRLPVQTTVEGIGVPVAIAISGVIILALGLLPSPLAATIAVTAVVCAIWTWVAFRLYRAYGPALVDALRRRPLLDVAGEIETAEGDEIEARRLLVSGDVRAQRLGLDLLTAMASPGPTAELQTLAEDPNADVRTAALVALAGRGDERARRRLAEEVRAGASSIDAGARLRAAQGLGMLEPSDRRVAVALLSDEDAAVRRAALDAVRAGDDFAVEPVVAALADAATLGAAAGAVERLGEAVVPAIAAALADVGTPAPPAVARLVRSAATRTPARDDVVRRHVGHPDRDLGLVVMERLVAPEPAADALAQALDDELDRDVRHAARILAAQIALAAAAGDEVGEADVADEPLRRALAEELDLVRRRVIAGRLARHGSAALGPAVIELGGLGQQAALALEALEVLLGAAEAKRVRPLLHPGLSPAQRLGQLPAPDPPVTARALPAWLRDIAEDAADEWRSPWLRACALYAARGRGLLDEIDLVPARSLGDPVIDEILAVRARPGISG